jgi:outer membrane protein TolC
MRNIALVVALAAGAFRTAGAQRDTIRALSLGDAARLAAQLSGTAVTAQYRAEQARGRARESRSALLPQLSGTFTDGQRTFNTASFGLQLPGFPPNGEVIGPVRTVDIRGRVVANLFDPAALARYRTATAAASGANAEAASATSQAAAIATASYVRALRADAQVGARAADSSLAMDLLAIARRQLEAGVGVALDVTRARAQLSGTRAQLIAARNERDRARLELLRALGLPATDSLALRDALDTTAAVAVPTEAEAIQSALNSRADLRAAHAATQTARRALSASRSEWFPTIGVFGDDGVTSASYNHLFPTYTYGVQFSLPIFTGFRTQARVQESSAAVKEAEAREHDIELQVITDVRGALLDLRSGQEQVVAAGERLGLAEQELAQARERFRAGVAGNADVITAQLSLNAARSNHIDALASLELARVALARAQGRLLELP